MLSPGAGTLLKLLPIGERRVGLVKGDVDEPAVGKGRRLLDQRDVVAQEQVGRVEPAGVVDGRRRLGIVGRQARRGVVRRAVGVEGAGEVVALAGGVVRVAAVVRRDPVERRDLVGRQGQVVRQAVGGVIEVGDVVGVAVGVRRPVVGAPGPSYSGVVGSLSAGWAG